MTELISPPGLDPPIDFDTCPVVDCGAALLMPLAGGGGIDDRAAVQYAAGGTTPSGLPYPLPQDYLSQTDTYIRDLDTAVAALMARPSMAVMGVTGFNTDVNGDCAFTWPQFSAIGGMVTQAIPSYSDFWLLQPILTAKGSNVMYCRWFYQTLTTGFNGNNAAVAWNSKGLYAMAIAWGTPL